MQPITGAGKYHLALQVKRFITCWAIQRTDDVIFRFTDSNEIVRLGGADFTPVEAVSTSARQRKSGLEENNFELHGVISSDTISENDLRTGKFRNARITEFLVDWLYPFRGAIITNVYFVEQTIHNGETWEAQVSGIPAKFKREVGSMFTRNCGWTLGDSRCQFDTNSVRELTRSVSSVIDNRNKFTANLITATTGWWDFGLVSWTSGLNAGLSSEIESNVSNTITLRFYMPYAIRINDQFTAIPGCNKLIQTCLNKFNNTIHYGGFPTIPGNDKLLQGPARGGAIAGKKF